MAAFEEDDGAPYLGAPVVASKRMQSGHRGPRQGVTQTWVRSESLCVMGSWDPLLERLPSALPANRSFAGLSIWRRGNILGDLLPIQSRGIREYHALGLAPALDEDGRGADERMLLDYLPDVWKELSELKERICLINGCSSRTEYHYHVLGKRTQFPMGRSHIQNRFKVSGIMDEEGRKIIVAGKHPEEVGVEQVSREVLRPDASIPSKWELLEEVLAKEGAKKTVSELRSVLDATRARYKGQAGREAGDLHLQKFSAEASLQRLSSQVKHAREEASRLSFELDIVRAERDGYD
ncbi:hypothetical protein ACLOJK_014696 [Asimina triloba]